MYSTIHRALISVSDKAGIVEFTKALHGLGVEILSTGGTAKLLQDAGIKVTEVSQHTGFPEIMDGRVKTLHPKIHGGLLGRRGVKEHQTAMHQHGIAPIDLLVINLYPFEETVKKGASYDDCVENIDIGGPAMIRSAAKNHEYVTVLTDPADYDGVLEEIRQYKGTATETRRRLAAKAFARTASYDSAISRWFAKVQEDMFPASLSMAVQKRQSLVYGENPHQKAAFYVFADAGPGVSTAKQLQGKELSYNNINDADAAFELVSEFDKPAVAIIKHANPCGVAIADSVHEAYLKAYACDTTSAYGGIVALNRPLDEATMNEIAKIFVEVIIAPDATAEAKTILEKKKNLRLLVTGSMPDRNQPQLHLRHVSGGLLLQQQDRGAVAETLKPVTSRVPTKQEMEDLMFAFTIAKHVKSNAIVLVKNGATIGIGAGQMSRVDSVRLSCQKAEAAGLSTQGTVLASDAFFPFDDNVHHAAKAGIVAIVQPGGSIRDEEVIKAADQHQMAMVFAGKRHFRH